MSTVSAGQFDTRDVLSMERGVRYGSERRSSTGHDRPAVLIVDDVPDNLLALEGMLRRADIDILTATSGRDALEILLQREVAVAIVDVMMPEMDGFELAQLVHGVERTRRVPIIFVTAASKAEYRVFTGYQAGAIDFLFKPLDERVLRAKVDVLVTLAKQQRELDRAREQAERAQRETGILLRLARATTQAQSPEDIYEPALDAVRDLLGADRSAILLFDGSDRMRFQAWRGLSEAYRAAVDGHSPWNSGTKDAQPILIADAATDATMAAYRSIFAAERISAIAFVPLTVRGRLLGKFMLYWAEPRTHSTHDEGLVLAIAAQVSEALDRAKTQEALRLTEEKLRAALAAGHMGVWEWHIPTGRVVWSPELQAIHGLVPGAFEGTFDAYQRDVHADDKENLLRTVQQTLEAGRDHQIEYRIVRPDGEVRWVAGFGKVLSRADGKPALMTGVCFDITERKRLEQTREAAIAELEQTLRYNEIFAGVLAHDLRNPLDAMLTATQVVLYRSDERDPLVAPLRRAVSSGRRMAKMIDQLLDFTKARVGGGFDLEPREADLSKLCGQVLDELKLAHPQWEVKLESGGNCVGIWDPDRLAQLVANLVTNAGQHGIPGAEILVTLDGASRDCMVLEVHNEGSISEALLPDLFSPFRATRKLGSSGLGLGIYIVREIARSHGGDVDFASTSATGTTFKVRLPRVTLPRAASTGRAAPNAARGGELQNMPLSPR